MPDTNKERLIKRFVSLVGRQFPGIHSEVKSVVPHFFINEKSTVYDCPFSECNINQNGTCVSTNIKQCEKPPKMFINR